MYKVIIIYCENHTQHINMLCGLNKHLCYSRCYHWALNVNSTDQFFNGMSVAGPSSHSFPHLQKPILKHTEARFQCNSIQNHVCGFIGTAGMSVKENY